MAYLKATIVMTLDVYTSRSFVYCNLFQMRCTISTDKRVTRSPCNSRATCITMQWYASMVYAMALHLYLSVSETLGCNRHK